MIPDSLFALPTPFVLSVIGAGGKTTAIKRIADYYRTRGKKVLVTTTTHMAVEEGRMESLEEIQRALDTEQVAFAGGIIEKGGREKLAPLPEEVLASAIAYADVTLIEADGSRRLPFKVPYPHEPVISSFTTHILLVAGMHAVGCAINTAAYNPEGVASVLGVDGTDPLTPALMAKAYRRTYLFDLRQRYPHIPVFVMASQDDSEELRAYAAEFERECKKEEACSI